MHTHTLFVNELQKRKRQREAFIISIPFNSITIQINYIEFNDNSALFYL
jgi:hypothetical protein